MRTLLDSIEAWASASVDPLEIDRTHDIGSALLEDLVQFGLFGASIPEAYGGSELSLTQICEIVGGLARIDRSIATTVGLHLGLGTRAFVAFGSDEQKSTLLPLLASGEWIAAFAATEAGAGSDLSAIRTKAVQDGETLVLNGEKVFVTNGGLADIFTVLVSTPGLGGARRGHSLIWLHADDAGLSLGAEEHKLGLRGSSTRSIYLDDVRLGLDRVVGEPGMGMHHAHQVLAWGRTVMAAGCVGAAAEALGRTLAHVRERRQFGKPLSALAVVREQLADMSALQFAMEAIVQCTAADEEDWEALARRSTSAKVFCSDGDWKIADLAIQLHGGSGFIEETGLPLLLRDARITRIFEGANDVLQTRIGATEAVGSPRIPLMDRWGNDPLALGADVHAVAVTALRQGMVNAHGARLLRDKRLLHRLGSAVVLREATDAAASRALDLGTPGARAHAEHWQTLAGKELAALHRAPSPTPPIDAILHSRFVGDFR